jgi:hypothetical protein
MDVGFRKQGGKSVYEQLPVVIIVENVTPFNPANDNMLEESGYVKSC